MVLHVKQTKKKRKRSAFDLVAESTTTSSHGKKWTEQLNSDDTTYVSMVLAAMKRTPGASPYIVARNLKKELGLDVSADTIAKTLKKLIEDDSKKSK